MRRNRIWRVALLAIMLTLAACGGGAPPTQNPVPSNPPTAAPATAAPPAAATNTTAPPAATNTTGTTSGNTVNTMNGVTLPADAAPADQQVYVQHFDNTAPFTTIDFYESVYGRAGAVADVLSDSL